MPHAKAQRREEECGVIDKSETDRVRNIVGVFAGTLVMELHHVDRLAEADALNESNALLAATPEADGSLALRRAAAVLIGCAEALADKSEEAHAKTPRRKEK